MCRFAALYRSSLKLARATKMSLGVFKISLTTLLHSGKVTMDALKRFGRSARLLPLSQYEAHVLSMQRVKNLWDRLYPRITNYVELLLHSEKMENSVAARAMEKELLFMRSTFASLENTGSGEEFSRLLVGKARRHLKLLFCLVMKQQAEVTFSLGLDEGNEVEEGSQETDPAPLAPTAKPTAERREWSAETELEQIASIITTRWDIAERVLAKRKGQPELRASQSTENLLANVSV